MEAFKHHYAITSLIEAEIKPTCGRPGLHFASQDFWNSSLFRGLKNEIMREKMLEVISDVTESVLIQCDGLELTVVYSDDDEHKLGWRWC